MPKAKTVRWTVFSESVAETLNCEHAAASECELLALNKPTDGAPSELPVEIRTLECPNSTRRFLLVY